MDSEQIDGLDLPALVDFVGGPGGYEVRVYDQADLQADPPAALTTFTTAKGKEKPAVWSNTEHYFDSENGMWMTHVTDSDGADIRYPQD